MLRVLAPLSLLFATGCAGTQGLQSSNALITALTNVTVIDVTATNADEARRPNQTVIVSGHRIAAIGQAGRARLPRGAQIIDGRGQFLVPGLWDSHTHLSMFGDAALPLFVSQGVTTIRDMGGTPAKLGAWQKAVADGERLGPRIFHAGSLIEGACWLDRVSAAIKKVPDLAYFPFLEVSPRLRLADLNEAPSLVSQIKASGADLVKFRNLREPSSRPSLQKLAGSACF